MVYTHVLNRGGLGMVSPVDVVLGADCATRMARSGADRRRRLAAYRAKRGEDGDRRPSANRGFVPDCARPGRAD